MEEQGKVWAGEFGDQYTDRNKIDWRNNLPLWRDVLSEFSLAYPNYSILEVGCNRGHNLRALIHQACGYGKWRDKIIGVDLNRKALKIAKSPAGGACQGNALNLSFRDNSFDLVFTMGVLIHIAPDNLATAINEMCRVSNKYVLAIEYHAKEETTITYQGRDNLLWKRDFQAEFLYLGPNLNLIRHWEWGTEEKPFYDRLDGWLFKKE